MPLEKVFQPLFGLKLMVLQDEPSACTRSANGQGLFCSPKRSREHVPETFGDVFALTGMFRDVTNDRLDLSLDAFRQNDPTRVERLALLDLLRGHGLRRLLPSPVLPREGAR